MRQKDASNISANVVKQSVVLPSIGKVAIGNGTVNIINSSTAVSSDEMLVNLKKASQKNLFPLQGDFRNE